MTKNTNEKFVSKKPQSYIIPITKLANELSKDFINNGVYEIEVGRKKKSAIIYASLTFDKENIQLPKDFTPFDREVLNAVCSLYNAGNIFIWADQVYRTMAGLHNTEYISPQCLKQTRESLDKHMYSQLRINFIEQIPFCKEKIENAELESNMLNMTKCSCIINGSLIIGYKLLAKPLLYDYSQKVGQVISIDMKYLDTKEIASNTMQNIIIKQYLLRRIEGMLKGKTLMSKKIKYETLFNECQLDIKQKTQFYRYKKTIKKFLDYWVIKKYINGYTETKKGNVFDGILIKI